MRTVQCFVESVSVFFGMASVDWLFELRRLVFNLHPARDFVSDANGIFPMNTLYCKVE
jgi:hypothetical protein